jgi:hypothetical protein
LTYLQPTDRLSKSTKERKIKMDGLKQFTILALVLVVMAIVINSTYNRGYRIGQIDAQSNNIHYQLTTNQTMEVVWVKVENSQ